MTRRKRSQPAPSVQSVDRPDELLPTEGERAAVRVAAAYFTEANLSFEAVEEVHSLEGNAPERFPWATDRLTPEERQEARDAELFTTNARSWAAGVWVVTAQKARGGYGGVALTPSPAPAEIPESEQQSVRAALDALDPPREGSVVVWQREPDAWHPIFPSGEFGPWQSTEADTVDATLRAHSPTYARLNARRLELWNRCKLTREEITARIHARLTRADGTRAPSPREWYESRGLTRDHFQSGLYWFQTEHTRLLRKEIEAELEIERARSRAAEAERKRLKRELAAAKRSKKLADRTVFPGQLIEAGYREKPHATYLAKAEQGDLFASPDTLNVLRQSTTIGTAQLTKLDKPEIRAMWGTFRVLTTAESAEDGTDTLRQIVELDAATLFHAMGLDTPNDKERRRHFEALMTLSRTPLRVAMKFQDDRGNWNVAGAETPMFQVAPMWRPTADGRRTITKAEAERTYADWLHAEPGTPWTGPLPDWFRIHVPNIIRKLDTPLVLAADTYAKLEAGAKKVRGEREGFTRLDWVLAVEITQTTQSAHGGRSYVNRDELLKRVYTPEGFAKQKTRGKLKGPKGYITQYELAVKVLEAGGLARRVRQDHRKAKGGVCDVFELFPNVVLRKQPDPVLPLPAGTPTRKKRSRRPG